MSTADRRPEPAEIVDAMNRFTTGVAIVTTVVDGRRHGATVAAVSLLATDPPMIAVSMLASSSTRQAIEQAGVFALTILDEDAASIAGRFASKVDDKFAGMPVFEDAAGLPLLPGLAHLRARIADVWEVGSHRELHAHVEALQVAEGHPLAYYGGAFARLETGADEAILAAVRAHVLDVRDDRQRSIDPEELAAAHNVSRGVVLRALSALVTESLVERSEGVYVVRPVPHETVDAAYDAKLAIELGVALQVVGRLSPDQLAELRAKNTRLRELIATIRYEDLDVYVAASHDFHEYFVGLAGSPSLVRAYRSLGLPGIDRRSMTRAIVNKLPVNDGYLAVVEAAERGDVEAAIAALRSEQRHPRYMREISGRSTPAR